MSKTALLEALRTFDVRGAREILTRRPELRDLRSDQGFDLLQVCCRRCTEGNPAAAAQQLRMAKWLVEIGFDPHALHTTAPGEDGEEEPSQVSLAWFAVAKARNDRLARYFLGLGAEPSALYAAAWWGNADIIADLVRHGADPNARMGATPLHMAVAVAQRGAHGRAEVLERRLQVAAELLRLGADPNVAASDGETPLHTAIRKEYPAVFRLLVRYGADPDLPGKDGRSVRQIAARKRDASWREAISATPPRDPRTPREAAAPRRRRGRAG